MYVLKNRSGTQKIVEVLAKVHLCLNLSLALDRQRRYDQKSEISAKVKYEKKITSSLKYASKPFCSYLRNKRKVKESVAALKREDDSVTVGEGW